LRMVAPLKANLMVLRHQELCGFTFSITHPRSSP